MNRLIHLVHGETWSIKLKGDDMGTTIGLGDTKEPGGGEEIKTLG